MKTKNWSQYIIAITVIGCSLILLAALTVAISGQPWGTHGRKLEVEFKDATGIRLHSSVRYAGAVAGSVVAIRYLSPAEREQSAKRDLAVRVTVRLNQGVPALPSDTKATISSETILGEKFVALSAGSPGVNLLPEGAVIEGESFSGIENLTQSLGNTVAVATEILRKFNGDYPELITNLNRLLISGDTLLTTATNLVNDAQMAVADVRGTLHQVDETVAGVRPQVSNLLTHASSVATNLNGTIDNTRLITADVQAFLANEFLANLDQTIKNLTSLLVRTEITMEYVKVLAARLAERPSRLIWQIRTNPVPSEAEIRRTLPAPTKRKPKE
ncbi:MAG: MlaD family protein [Verrucomicrobiota bacterium]|jgi:phospholipid/cholesterol/gamma-HCH transport system substrate-binding protein